MGHRLTAAAAEAGIRITLLDTLYLTATVDGEPVDGRAAAGSATDRSTPGRSASAQLKPAPHALVGAAAHSVRAVPAAALAGFADRTHASRCTCTCPSSGPRTRPAGPCTAAPRPRCSTGTACSRPAHRGARHPPRRRRSGPARRQRPGSACARPPSATWPTGIGPARALADAGSPLCAGQRQPRGDRPVRGGPRGRAGRAAARPSAAATSAPDELLAAATAAGHAALGWADAGRRSPSAPGPTWSPSGSTAVRAAGFDPADPAAASCSRPPRPTSPTWWSTAGRSSADGRHLLVDDVPAALHRAVTAVWR